MNRLYPLHKCQPRPTLDIDGHTFMRRIQGIVADQPSHTLVTEHFLKNHASLAYLFGIEAWSS